MNQTFFTDTFTKYILLWSPSYANAVTRDPSRSDSSEERTPMRTPFLVNWPVHTSFPLMSTVDLKPLWTTWSSQTNILKNMPATVPNAKMLNDTRVSSGLALHASSNGGRTNPTRTIRFFGKV